MDPDNPRDLKREKEDDAPRTRLLRSIDKLGIENPLIVCAMKVPDRYLIIDGHRRYLCAKALQLETVPCRIYPKLPPTELALRRFEVQNNRVEWGPLERAEAFAQIKRAEGFEKDKELASFLGLSTTTVSFSLKLLSGHSKYKEMFEAINTLIGRKVRTKLEVDILKDPDTTTEELKEQTGETWLATMLERVQQALAKRLSSGKGLTPEEEVHRAELQDFLISIDLRQAKISREPKMSNIVHNPQAVLASAA